MYKMVELDEETPVQYVGVHPLKWRPEWGMPKVGFVEADNDHESLKESMNNSEIGYLEREIAQLRTEMKTKNMASSKALDRLWKSVVLAKKGDDYGTWEYPGEVVNTIKELFAEVLTAGAAKTIRIGKLTESLLSHGELLEDMQGIIDKKNEKLTEAKEVLVEATNLIEQRDKEIELDNGLLASYARLIDEIPECSMHGKRCIPHAREWVRAAIKELPCANQQ